MNLRAMHPLVKGWRWMPRDVDLRANPPVIEPGRSFDLIQPMFAQGWLIGASIWLDNDNAQWVMEYDDVRADVSPVGLLTAGSVQPRIGFWLSRYDDTVTPNMFCIQLAPAEGLEFKAQLRAYVYNPTLRADRTPNTICRIYAYHIVSIEIVDIIKYRQSLRDIMEHRFVPPSPPIIEGER